MKIEVRFGYFLMTDFKEHIGSRNNYGGFDFLIGVGYVWGGG
ncbi:MAG: hypothetical protein AAB393_01425 [Bacteroidota bacterium]